MIRKIFVVITLFVLTFSFAQEGTTSPYSYYGMGDLKFKGTIENQAMGGLSVYSDSIHLNLRNPSSLADLKLTTFTAGISHHSIEYHNATDNKTKNHVSFDYLAVGFPLSNKMGLSFGIMPYTAVGYDLTAEGDLDGQQQIKEFTGEGGLNKVFLSLGYKITHNLSLGITGNYDFGKLDNTNSVLTEDVIYGTREVNASELSGIDFNIGANYQGKILGDLIVRTSASFTPEAKISSLNTRTVSTFLAGSTSSIETEEVDLEAMGLRDTDLILPSNFTLGVGLGKQYKWFVGSEVQSIRSSEFSNPLLNIQNVEYKNGYTFSVGGFYIPNYSSLTSYWSKVVYRAGFRFEETGLMVNNQEINNFGISFGVGLPVGGFSNLNLNFEYGNRGTINAGLIEEDYFNVKLSLSLNERWFVKRKYD
ncbi:outer membrane protein transport protein [Abyssalbus ytuae]|uniref:Outer membrane protein transport protein n=1 Tax=Abyssalbus ytuae TaxID=2926907 RepID=A0A9E7CUN6_9FLAO|nr:outer membrane protein transport protein [Abyssalbus ytuae]UOB18732.1 outer membrane protein transport protein [Abyssalbus ytuae]